MTAHAASEPNWRPVIAALANDEVRRVAAAAMLGDDVEGPLAELAPSRRRHVAATLTKSGLCRTDADGTLVFDPRVFARLLAARATPARQGVDKYLVDGRIEQFPASPSLRDELLERVAGMVLGAGEQLSEPELNARIAPIHDDVARVRRALVDHGFVERAPDGSRYGRAAR